MVEAETPTMLDIDFAAHNREAAEVWEAYYAGHPIRVPVFLGINVRYWLLSPWLNPRKITFQEYFEDADLMLETQLEFLSYVFHNLLQDAPLGVPEAGWQFLKVDLQNCYDAGWFGCPVRHYDGQVPDTEPILHDDNKGMLFDRGIPDPLRGGLMEKNLRFYERMLERSRTITFQGAPVTLVWPAGLNTDGVFTAAANLRGATELCVDVCEDPDYVKELLAFVTEALIVRVKAWRELAGEPLKPEVGGFADDCAQLLSVDAYREFVLPCHKRLFSELAGKGPHCMHMCGDASHLLKTMRDELNVKSFDTGYPIDFGQLRGELGPDVEIKGGPSVQFLMQAAPDQVREECRRVLDSGVMEGGRFVLREGNNMAPGTPEENISAMYYAAKEFGGYASR